MSDSGGWCSSIGGRNSTEHITDDNLTKALSNFLANKRVASFGDGPGIYKEKIDMRLVKYYLMMHSMAHHLLN